MWNSVILEIFRYRLRTYEHEAMWGKALVTYDLETAISSSTRQAGIIQESCVLPRGSTGSPGGALAASCGAAGDVSADTRAEDCPALWHRPETPRTRSRIEQVMGLRVWIC